MRDRELIHNLFEIKRGCAEVLRFKDLSIVSRSEC